MAAQFSPNPGSPQSLSSTGSHPVSEEAPVTRNNQSDLKITSNDLKRLRIAYTTDLESAQPCQSVDFSPNGLFGVFSTNAAVKFVQLEPEQPRSVTVTLGKYGVGTSKFLDDYKIIHSSKKVNHAIRMLDITDKQYICYFDGHEDEVTSLDVSLHSANFASSSKDKNVLLWDRRERKPVASKKYSECPLIAYHPTEQELAVAYLAHKDSYTVDILDLRKLSRFKIVTRFQVEDQDFLWTKLTYSNNGNFLMINTNDTLTIVVDAVTGAALHRFVGEYFFCVT